MPPAAPQGVGGGAEPLPRPEIGNPGLPLSAAVKARVTPIAQAISPILEPMQVDRLRGHFLRFVEEGGRTNLQRWATAVDCTSARSGLLLSNDLGAARAMIAQEDAAGAEEKMDDLLVFVTSERYAKLRKQLGVAIGGERKPPWIAGALRRAERSGTRSLGLLAYLATLVMVPPSLSDQ